MNSLDWRQMSVQSLLDEARIIWGNTQMGMPEIIIAMGVVYGDICRWERDQQKVDSGIVSPEAEAQLAKELGNMILSTIRWIDDLGLDPEDCIQYALTAQREFVQKRGA